MQFLMEFFFDSSASSKDWSIDGLVKQVSDTNLTHFSQRNYTKTETKKNFYRCSHLIHKYRVPNGCMYFQNRKRTKMAKVISYM